MAIALKGKTEQTKPTAAEQEDDETEAWYEEMPDFPFDYAYDRQGYLISDGQPLAETSIHRREITNNIEELDAHFAARPNVYVSGCDYVHYKRGDKTTQLSPDAYVVFDVPKDKVRENFKVFEEGGNIPAIVFEFTSKKTKKADEGEKFATYEQILKIPEYILFDPRPFKRPRVRLRGFRLNTAGSYEALPLNADGRMYSEQLDLYLEEQGQNLRLFDAKTGEYLRTPQESEAQRKTAEAQRKTAESRADEEARLRRETEAKFAALMAELEALRNQKQNEQG